MVFIDNPIKPNDQGGPSQTIRLFTENGKIIDKDMSEYNGTRKEVATHFLGKEVKGDSGLDDRVVLIAFGSQMVPAKNLSVDQVKRAIATWKREIESPVCDSSLGL